MAKKKDTIRKNKEQKSKKKKLASAPTTDEEDVSDKADRRKLDLAHAKAAAASKPISKPHHHPVNTRESTPKRPAVFDINSTPHGAQPFNASGYHILKSETHLHVATKKVTESPKPKPSAATLARMDKKKTLSPKNSKRRDDVNNNSNSSVRNLSMPVLVTSPEGTMNQERTDNKINEAEGDGTNVETTRNDDAEREKKKKSKFKYILCGVICGLIIVTGVIVAVLYFFILPSKSGVLKTSHQQ